MPSYAEESQPSLAQKFLGKAIFYMAGSPLWETAYQTFPDDSNQGSEARALDFGQRSKDGSQMVDTNSGRRSGVADTSNSLAYDHRRLSVNNSSLGWGVTLDHRSVSEVWTDREAGLHNNHIELLAMMRAVQAFILILRNKGITVHIDNVTAAFYLLKEGGTRSAPLNELTRDLLGYCSR